MKEKEKRGNFGILRRSLWWLPVVDRRRVGLGGLIEVVAADGLGGEVAARVEDAPPNVLPPRRHRRRGRGRRPRRLRAASRHRHRPLVLAAALSIPIYNHRAHRSSHRLIDQSHPLARSPYKSQNFSVRSKDDFVFEKSHGTARDGDRLGGGDLPQLAEAALRLRPGQDVVPQLL